MWSALKLGDFAEIADELLGELGLVYAEVELYEFAIGCRLPAGSDGILSSGQLASAQKTSDRGLDRSIVLDPLVDPGNPPHRHEACQAAASRAPASSLGQRAQSPSEAKIAAVILERFDPSAAYRPG
ncbi:hypothetical protein ACNJX9_34855 [Bradyrhizobium sp. DASA03076]|uniref:hypothetical protein n=1 Tax=Bradyrhizobium sp. BLXBL-03 TaxID=3395916 RepID=UPI003F70B83A